VPDYMQKNYFWPETETGIGLIDPLGLKCRHSPVSHNSQQ